VLVGGRLVVRDYALVNADERDLVEALQKRVGR
jgi:hypothetical protein